VRLFCIPHAGGSARVFRPWRPYLRTGIELRPIELPGRGERAGEPPYREFADGVDDIARHIAEQAGGEPYAVYGHSLGALLGYEAVHRLAERGHPAPRHLFASGCRPPHRPRRRPTLHTLPDEALLGAMTALGGAPGGLLTDPEATRFFACLIRADYRIFEGYRHGAGRPRLPCPISAVFGTDDPVTSVPEARRWSELGCAGAAALALEDAGHFFLTDRAAEITTHINTTLRDGAGAGGVSSDLFREAMANLPAPVTVVTTLDGAGRVHAFTASAVCALSLDPPLLMVAVGRANGGHDAFTTADRFMVNILAGSHGDLARRYARSGAGKHEGGCLTPLELGLPGLPDAVARVACVRHDVLDGGDHSALVGRVVATSVSDRGPLIGFRRVFTTVAPTPP
jgi:surfactin synthase thioesterase subunit/flavin reductase (DIM6/NTAB) family NADH-FMN oxidoreductase RutF